MMKYWIYESWTLNKAIVHAGVCAYCEEGTNRQGDKTGRNGSWTGPFNSADIALTAAARTQRKVARGCAHCMDMNVKAA